MLGSQWLVAAGHSSFSATAAAWGLGPGGRMERFDAAAGLGTARRLDWEAPPCTVVGAADPSQAAACPNGPDPASD